MLRLYSYHSYHKETFNSVSSVSLWFPGRVLVVPTVTVMLENSLSPMKED